MDKKNSYELISYIKYSIYLIEERFGSISTSSDFLSDNIGVEKLDSISMRLQSIGEAIKNILKNDSTLLTQFAQKSYWSDIVRFRDIISHHYIDIDSEVVFDICDEDLRELKELIISIEKSLKS
jgi:uncharacterized protein with HEPN domain